MSDCRLQCGYFDRVKSFTCTFVVTVSVLAAAIAGCDQRAGGKPTAHLSGTVTIDDQPVPADAWGTINFRPTAPGQSGPTSAQVTDSQYDCPDVPMGAVDVNIQIVQRTGKMLSDGGRSWPETRSLIADKYTSGIKLDVTEDNSNQDFVLTSK